MVKYFKGKLKNYPLTILFSNSFYQNLTDIYSLKELLYSDGIADINGLALVKLDNSVHSLLPNGYETIIVLNSITNTTGKKYKGREKGKLLE